MKETKNLSDRLIIKIVAVGDVPEKLLSDLPPRLMESFALLVDDCRIGEPIEIPPTAYDALREQHNADILLDHVRRSMPGNDKVLALTAVDIFSQGKNFLFGQAQCPGNTAIISICRMNPVFYGAPADHELLLERATKEAVHELAHNFGLDHCKNLNCVMSFSNSIYEVDRKTSAFCEVCRKKLLRNK
jgi:archaemetzincin